jgi:hypothetical protein
MKKQNNHFINLKNYAYVKYIKKWRKNTLMKILKNLLKLKHQYNTNM